jgi:hypothetical protein
MARSGASLCRRYGPFLSGATPVVKALLAILALALTSACSPTPPPPQAAPATVEALTPNGATDWPVTFTWKTSARPGGVCRVNVYDIAERPLYERDTREGRLAAPVEVQRLAGSRLLWRVSVVGDNGTVVAQSPLVEFALK